MWIYWFNKYCIFFVFVLPDNCRGTCWLCLTVLMYSHWVTAEDKGSLVGVLSLCEHVGLQLGEVALLMTTLADPHVQQVGVYGRVVGLQQPALNVLSFRDKHSGGSDPKWTKWVKMCHQSDNKDNSREGSCHLLHEHLVFELVECC